MLALISCAKLMRTAPLKRSAESLHKLFSEPAFGEQASYIAEHLREFSAQELSVGLGVNETIAQETFRRYQLFGGGEMERLPALYAYNGIVFKSIEPEKFDEALSTYAQSHLRITSFLYGLLRPFDTIEPYRLEGKFVFDQTAALTPFNWWADKLTDKLIEDIKSAGGLLCNLASGEMKRLFDYRRLCKEVEVIEPEFYTQQGEKRKTIVVHTKIARGLMTRYILENRVTSREQLAQFKLGGYRHIGDMKFLRE